MYPKYRRLFVFALNSVTALGIIVSFLNLQKLFFIYIFQIFRKQAWQQL